MMAHCLCQTTYIHSGLPYPRICACAGRRERDSDWWVPVASPPGVNPVLGVIVLDAVCEVARGEEVSTGEAIPECPHCLNGEWVS